MVLAEFFGRLMLVAKREDSVWEVLEALWRGGGRSRGRKGLNVLLIRLESHATQCKTKIMGGADRSIALSMSPSMHEN